MFQIQFEIIMPHILDFLQPNLIHQRYHTKFVSEVYGFKRIQSKNKKMNIKDQK